MQVPYGDEECNMNEYHLCNKETIVRALDCRCTYTGAFQLQLYKIIASRWNPAAWIRVLPALIKLQHYSICMGFLGTLSFSFILAHPLSFLFSLSALLRLILCSLSLHKSPLNRFSHLFNLLNSISSLSNISLPFNQADLFSYSFNRQIPSFRNLWLLVDCFCIYILATSPSCSVCSFLSCFRSCLLKLFLRSFTVHVFCLCLCLCLRFAFWPTPLTLLDRSIRLLSSLKCFCSVFLLATCSLQERVFKKIPKGLLEIIHTR